MTESLELTNCYLIIGGVGFGKTTLVDYLCDNYGFYRVPEIARELLLERMASTENPLIWSSTQDYIQFEQELLNRRIQILESLPLDTTCFADTGIPNAQVFFSRTNIKTPPFIKNALKSYRYNSKVFFTPPWRKIYRQDMIRPQTYDESVEISDLVLKTYQELGYQIIELPYASVPSRSEFILEHI